MNTQHLTPFHYRIILKDISEGKSESFEAYVPAFHAYNFGNSPDEALEAYKIYFISEKKRRDDNLIAMPQPDIMLKQKQVPLRLNINLYERVVDLARRRGMSFNKYVGKVLEESGE